MAREDFLHKLVLKEGDGEPGRGVKMEESGMSKGLLRRGAVHVQEEGRAAQLGRRG